MLSPRAALPWLWELSDRTNGPAFPSHFIERVNPPTALWPRPVRPSILRAITPTTRIDQPQTAHRKLTPGGPERDYRLQTLPQHVVTKQGAKAQLVVGIVV
jgi:hypothetical protein